MPKNKLTPVVELIKNSFQIYFKKENLIYLTKIALVYFGIVTLSSIPLFFLAPSSFGFIHGFKLFSQARFDLGFWNLAAVLISLLAVIIIVLWMQATLIVAVSLVAMEKIISVRETLARAWSSTKNLFIQGVLGGLVVTLGLVLLIIPGLVFGVWFTFAGFLVVAGGLGAIESLKKSKAMVSGIFWAVAGRNAVFIILIGLIQMGASFIPYAGGLVLILFSPYYVLLPYLLYEDVKRFKAGEEA
ncbi:MAG: hypothetical protein AAB685_01055 [Patescibacteria group bacterium]